MDHSPGSLPSSDASSKSTHSGYPPGTPKPPIEPPRRRSSLFFSKVLHHSHSPKTPIGDSTEPTGDQTPGTKAKLPNTGRKRMPLPLTRPIGPGHVAQMQRLFQSAKASLRLDVRFAASPVGSIDARLPTSPEGNDGDSNFGSPTEVEKKHLDTPSKNWRYSRAPGFLAEFDVDVREPFPEGSPQLPDFLPVEMDHSKVMAVEPPSSGFTSPLDQAAFNLQLNDQPILSSPPAPGSSRNPSREEDESPSRESFSASDLERPLTELRVSDDHDMDVDSLNESPIISHLKRKSEDVEDKFRDSSSESEGRIVLSPSAKAAADSAKLKRGLFSDLFPKPPTHKGSSDGTASPSSESQHPVRACPDPLLHHGGPAVRCPDPTAHFASRPPNIPGYRGIAPSPKIYPNQHEAPGSFGHAPMHFSRATATGSPMPLLKVKSPPISLGEMRQGSRYPPPESSNSRPQYRPHDHLSRAYIATASEHFQPGWYYAKASPQSSPRHGIPMYSFSTAAAKVVGQDPAPDSRIRDSYRTDTLTPLAKPLSRFKKNGMSALASARGVGKHYGRPSSLSRPPQRCTQSTRSRLPDSLQFRSSPPRPSMDTIQLPHPRKRSRNVVSPTTNILEDETTEKVPMDPRLKLEEGDEVIEVDEETRAAVRMSLFGTATPETGSDAGGGLQELSPNVMLYRKGTGPPGSRKKRRPSYWDGDLEEVMRSSAARHVVSSPIKKDDVRSLQADVEFQEECATKENPAHATELQFRDISQLAEGPSVSQEVKMEAQDLGGSGHDY